MLGHRRATTPQGHAVEVRLYAEDPAHDWQPQSGRLTRFEIPGVAARFERPATSACGSTPGSRPATRSARTTTRCSPRSSLGADPGEAALRRLAGALERAEIHGVRTNRDLLVEVLRHAAFVAGRAVAPTSSSATTSRPCRHARRPRTTLTGRPRSPRRSPSRSGPVPRTPCSSGCRPAGATSPPSRSAPRSSRREEVVAEWYGGRDGYRSADGTLTAELSGGDVVIATSAS